MSITAAEEDLSRVTVISTSRRVDLALPGSVSLSELLPSILRFSGLESNNPTDAVHAWVLQRFGADPFDLYAPVSKLGIRDGETLYLRQRENAMPDAAFDDVVDAVSSATNSRPSWVALHSRRLALALMLLMLVGIPLLVILAQPPIDYVAAELNPGLRLPLALAVGFASFLAFAAFIGSVALARAARETHAAAGLAWGSVALAGLSGWHLPEVIAAEGGVTLPVRIILAAALVLIAAAAAALSARVHPMALLAVSLTSLFVLTAASFMALFPGSEAKIAAITMTVMAFLTTFLPTLSYRIAGIALPNLPVTTEAMLADETPVQSDIVGRALLADRLLGAMLAATSITAVLMSLMAIGQATVWATVLVLAVGLAFLLRARAFIGLTQRLSLLLGGVVLVVVAALAFAADRATSLVGILVLFVIALVLTYVFAHYAAAIYARVLSPTWGRWGDILEWLAIIAIVPALLGVLKLYEYFGSMFA